MNSEIIYKMVEKETGLKLGTNSRKRMYVYGRGVANALCKQFTTDSLATIGMYSNTDHSSVLNSVRCFYSTYIRYSEYHKNLYLTLYEILEGMQKEMLLKKAKKEYAEALQDDPANYVEIAHKYMVLREENEKLLFDLKKKEADFVHKLKEENPLITLVLQVPREKIDTAYLRISTMIKML